MEMDDYKASPHLIPDIPGILVEKALRNHKNVVSPYLCSLVGSLLAFLKA